MGDSHIFSMQPFVVQIPLQGNTQPTGMESNSKIPNCFQETMDILFFANPDIETILYLI